MIRRIVEPMKFEKKKKKKKKKGGKPLITPHKLLDKRNYISRICRFNITCCFDILLLYLEWTAFSLYLQTISQPPSSISAKVTHTCRIISPSYRYSHSSFVMAIFPMCIR